MRPLDLPLSRLHPLFGFQRQPVPLCIRVVRIHLRLYFHLDGRPQVSLALRDLVKDLEPYCVVKEKYTKHADMLRNSVVHWERRGHLFFIMKDELAVKEALEQGAERLDQTEFVLGI